MLQSPVDIALVAGVLLLLFGPKKLPELGKAIGLGIGNFKRGLLDAQDEMKSAIKEEPAQTKIASSTGVSGVDSKATGGAGAAETSPEAEKFSSKTEESPAG